MARVFMSSGDLAADRRFDYARDLQGRGDLAAAADLLEQAIALKPDFASAWFTLGDVRESLGDPHGAAAAFRRAREADPLDRHGAAPRLMRLGAMPLAPLSPDYVTALYDQYAPQFEQSLVGELGYRGPALLQAAVAACDAPRFRSAIDLGCGTGLAARAFAGQAERFLGIDLSPAMIARARASGLYAELVVADAVDGLRRQPAASADLLLAADMMIYLHDLAPFFTEAARVLVPRGLLAFTAETHDGAGVVLGDGLRYAHSEIYLRSVIADAGLEPAYCDSAPIRREKHVPVPSLVMVAAKPAQSSSQRGA